MFMVKKLLSLDSEKICQGEYRTPRRRLGQRDVHLLQHEDTIRASCCVHVERRSCSREYASANRDGKYLTRHLPYGGIRTAHPQLQ